MPDIIDQQNTRYFASSTYLGGDLLSGSVWDRDDMDRFINSRADFDHGHREVPPAVEASRGDFGAPLKVRARDGDIVSLEMVGASTLPRAPPASSLPEAVDEPVAKCDKAAYPSMNAGAVEPDGSDSKNDEDAAVPLVHRVVNIRTKHAARASILSAPTRSPETAVEDQEEHAMEVQRKLAEKLVRLTGVANDAGGIHGVALAAESRDGKVDGDGAMNGKSAAGIGDEDSMWSISEISHQQGKVTAVESEGLHVTP
ncbi:hypothetical protein HDU76_009700, partial [Blyttiomyces sp. JEL0837]